MPPVPFFCPNRTKSTIFSFQYIFTPKLFKSIHSTMKISKEDFEKMKAKYDQEVKKGKPAKGNKHDIEDQTNWESFTKEDLLEVLNQEGVTGLKFYLTEYPQDVAEEFFGKEADLYVGRLNLVYSPIYASSGTERSGSAERDEYYDRGTVCPPTCQ